MKYPEVAIVGAGISGLMVAYELSKLPTPPQINVYDEGSDPRNSHTKQQFHCATYLGMNARHISAIESAPLFSLGRAALLGKTALYGGWDLLDNDKTVKELEWVRELYSLSSQKNKYESSKVKLYELNRTGVAEWAELFATAPEIFEPIDSSPVIYITSDSSSRLRQFGYEERLQNTTQKDEMEGSGNTDTSLFDPGSFSRKGNFKVNGYSVRPHDTCIKLISELESRDVSFIWNQTIASDVHYKIPLLESTVIYCAGIGSKPTSHLLNVGVNIQGLAGCWVDLSNPGFIKPFKIVGEDPISIMNCTPDEDRLLVSGGYGWTGEKNIDQSKSYLTILKNAFRARVEQAFDKNLSDMTDRVDVSVCIRPTTPSGLPVVGALSTETGQQLLINAGHSSAGYTQAPYLAKLIVKNMAFLRD